jgi:hypothetical protein
MTGTAAILGAATARTALADLGDFDEIVILESSVDALEQLIEELADPRLDYLLGALPVLPLPDGSIDRIVGDFAADDPEIARVTVTRVGAT